MLDDNLLLKHFLIFISQKGAVLNLQGCKLKLNYFAK